MGKIEGVHVKFILIYGGGGGGGGLAFISLLIEGEVEKQMKMWHLSIYI